MALAVLNLRFSRFVFLMLLALGNRVFKSPLCHAVAGAPQTIDFGDRAKKRFAESPSLRSRSGSAREPPEYPEEGRQNRRGN